MWARSCAQQPSRHEGGSGIFNFVKSGEGHGAGAFELGGWGCVPGCYISSPATLHAWPVQKADWNVGQTPPPPVLSLSLSVSIPFCHKHYSTAEVRKTERMCDIACKPLFWLIKSNKKIKNSSRACVACCERYTHSAFISEIFTPMFVNMTRIKLCKT